MEVGRSSTLSWAGVSKFIATISNMLTIQITQLVSVLSSHTSSTGSSSSSLSSTSNGPKAESPSSANPPLPKLDATRVGWRNSKKRLGVKDEQSQNLVERLQHLP
jgi:hypothetical protein